MIIMGLVIGALVGLTGVGGAALLTPALIMLGINPTIAVGTDLMINSITKLFGSIQHYRQKTIDKKLVTHLAIGSVPGAVIAVLLIHLLPSSDSQDNFVKQALGCVLVLVALATLFKIIFDKHIKENSIQKKSLDEKIVLTITIGFILGFFVGLTSVGSGSLFALVMIFLYRLKASELVGTDIAHAFILVTVAGLLHAGAGNVDFMLAVNILIGSIPGVILGSGLSRKVPERPLRAVMATIILLSGIQLI